jgi:hypothetical protein
VSNYSVVKKGEREEKPKRTKELGEKPKCLCMEVLGEAEERKETHVHGDDEEDDRDDEGDHIAQKMETMRKKEIKP